MFRSSRRIALLFVVFSSCLNCTKYTILLAQQTKKAFTVADEIGIAHFGDPYYKEAEVLIFSPDGNYFAVDTERGRLELDRVDDTLRFYRVEDVAEFVNNSRGLQPPPPVWIVNRSGEEGPIIRNWRWLPDSTGVVFLERQTDGRERLVLADLRTKTIEPLTSATESVGEFDIRDRRHYVYTTVDPDETAKKQQERRGPQVVGTGRSLFELLLPDDPRTVQLSSPPRYLWAVVDQRRFEVKHEGTPLAPQGYLTLSPDGISLATTLAVSDIPPSWPVLYPPPYPSSPYRIRPGVADSSAHQFVLIGLESGSVATLADAPTSEDAGWPVHGIPNWSSDGKAILLPGTFIQSKDQAASRPCVAIVDLPSNMRTCIETLKGRTETGLEEGYHTVRDARFVGVGRQHIVVSFYKNDDHSVGTTEYEQGSDGSWSVVAQADLASANRSKGLEVTVKESLTEPPLLVAKGTKEARVIWDPNPQLKNIELTEAHVFSWKDTKGHEWRGGLYGPRNYKIGQRYPLVIQTHGFEESEFRPSGIYPTAYAARALAAAGILVLQAPIGNCPGVTPEEGPCVVSGYEAAVHQLVSEGLVDPERIGIIGFSWPCFHVMEALTMSSLNITAASVTDGTMTDYFQYLVTEEGSDKENSNAIAYQDDTIIGNRPFGEGLQLWLMRSPTFQLDKVKAPLLVVGQGPDTLLFMWGTYAGLRYLHKPVDLIMLNTDEHVLTNPSLRMASQGGSVDWFRFWLQGYEDPDPSKVEQYRRWRNARILREANEIRSIAPPAASN
jgi:dipeptidyl aminopeptidase/acylaminoacyl peptidase